MDKKVHEAFYGKNNKYFVHAHKVSTRPLLGWEGHRNEASNELTYSNCLKQDVAQRRVDKNLILDWSWGYYTHNSLHSE